MNFFISSPNCSYSLQKEYAPVKYLMPLKENWLVIQSLVFELCQESNLIVETEVIES